MERKKNGADERHQEVGAGCSSTRRGGGASLKRYNWSEDLQLVGEMRMGIWGHAKAQRQEGA